MKRLGEILLDWGVIAVPELHTGLEACQRTGGRLGTQLLKFGFVDEHRLLDALAEQTGVKPVSSSRLERADLEVLSLLPAKHARRLRAVPFQESGGVLMVAMINPLDPVAIEELAEITGRAIQPHVATEASVSEAIHRLEGEPERGRATAVDQGPVTGWDALWAPPVIGPQQLLEIPIRVKSRAASQDPVATFPGLAPVDPTAPAEPDRELDEQTFRELLSESQHRDEIGRLVLRYAAAYFGRVCLFAVHRGSVVGWMARGPGPVTEDVQGFSVPIDDDSLFHEFRFGTGYHLGPIPDDRENQPLVSLLGDPPPLGALMVPIRIKDRAVAFVIGDNPAEEEVTAPVDEVTAALAAAGLALEVLILRKKILTAR
jgi:hypothetical protein